MLIKIDEEAMASVSSQVRVIADEIIDLKSKMDNLINGSLPEAWVGVGYEKYQERYETEKQNFDNMYSLVSEIGEAVVKASNEYAQNDVAVGNAFAK